MKTCPDCGRPTNRPTNAVRCWPCAKKRKYALSAAWHKAHPDIEGRRAYQKMLYNLNPDKKLARSKAWLERNRSRRRAWAREYRRRKRAERRISLQCQTWGCPNTLGFGCKKFCEECSRFYEPRKKRRRQILRQAA